MWEHRLGRTWDASYIGTASRWTDVHVPTCGKNTLVWANDVGAQTYVDTSFEDIDDILIHKLLAIDVNLN